jgi:hypothetical protein
MSDKEYTDAELIDRRRHRKTITLSTVVSILAIVGVVLPVLGLVLSPFAIQVISNAMGGEIKKQVVRQVTPINEGFKVLLASTIQQLENEAAMLNYRRRTTPTAWTLADEQLLLSKQQNLSAQKRALAAIERAEKNMPAIDYNEEQQCQRE